MLLELLLAFAQQEGDAGDIVPPGGSLPELAIAKKENRTLLVIHQSEDKERKANVEKLLKNSSIRREIQYEFVVAYRSQPSHPEKKASTLFTFHDSTGQGIADFTYADLLMDNGKPNAQKFLTLLEQNESTPWDALEVLETARQTAIQENKRLLIHLGAPW